MGGLLSSVTQRRRGAEKNLGDFASLREKEILVESFGWL